MTSSQRDIEDASVQNLQMDTTHSSEEGGGGGGGGEGGGAGGEGGGWEGWREDGPASMGSVIVDMEDFDEEVYRADDAFNAIVDDILHHLDVDVEGTCDAYSNESDEVFGQVLWRSVVSLSPWTEGVIEKTKSKTEFGEAIKENRDILSRDVTPSMGEFYLQAVASKQKTRPYTPRHQLLIVGKGSNASYSLKTCKK